MGEDIAFKNGRISDFQGLMTLTLDRVMLHTVMHQILQQKIFQNNQAISSAVHKFTTEIQPRQLVALSGK